MQEKIRLEWQDVNSVVFKREAALYFILDTAKRIFYVEIDIILKILIKS